MAIIKTICPVCGKETQADDTKSYAFCTNCGNRFELKHMDSVKEINVSKQDLEKGLKDVEFYYGLSKEKNEAKNNGQNPEYYEKAQEVLLKLSKSFPNDYRVWWELSKPIDFFDPSKTDDINNEYGINNQYFNKALDLAELENKKQLVEFKDNYISKKDAAIKKAKTIADEKERERKKQEEAEERKRQEKAEAERKAQEEKAAAERKAQEERAAAERKAYEEREAERLKIQQANEEELRKKKEAAAQIRPLNVAMILMILTWVLFITIIPPVIMGIISMYKAKLFFNDEKYSKRAHHIFIADIVAIVLMAIVFVLAIVFGA